jgi:hypothetical protein
MAKKSSRTRTLPSGETQFDYVEHGSDEHAAFLGIRKAEKGDVPELIIEGWTLVDLNPYGVFGWTKERKRELLAQKVSEFLTPPPEMQSEDPQAPHYAPPMWTPLAADEEPVSGII